jgi:ABC-2 type transport system ATP-binding protein
MLKIINNLKDKNIIDVENLTKDYGSGRGIFHVNLKIKKGSCYGFLGPNGAGKTTTIRHVMGFQHAKNPDQVKINQTNI